MKFRVAILLIAAFLLSTRVFPQIVLNEKEYFEGPGIKFLLFHNNYMGGFQGGLQWYRCGTSGAFTPELQTFSGRTIDVPSCFISGKQDWGTYQRPGVYEVMQTSACTRMLGCHLVDGAGHWVQQEQPEQVTALLLKFLQQCPR